MKTHVGRTRSVIPKFSTVEVDKERGDDEGSVEWVGGGWGVRKRK